jgi:serine/threonine protein kinase
MQSYNDPDLQAPKKSLFNTKTITHFLKKIDPKEIEFEQNNELAQGAFAVVRKGKWNNLAVAIKTKKNNTQGIDHGFDNEIQIADYLAGKQSNKQPSQQSNNSEYPLINIHGYNNNMIVMELMQHGDLIDFLQKYDEENDQAILPHIALDFFKGLELLHFYNIIHRDIKCDNVLLDANKRAKICDFGFSVFANDAHQYIDKAALGTLEYAAPEILEPDDGEDVCYSFATDMYAAAILIYILFAQRNPYPSKYSKKQILDAVLNDERPAIPYDKIKFPFFMFITCSWNKHQHERFSASEAIETVERYVNNARPSF